MGMFDYIECQYPLPDGFVPAVGELAQSKDTDSQYLDVYQMRADGSIWHLEPSSHHGALQFYYYNPKTKESHEYVALYDHGKLLKIETVETT